jgi:TolA-binding protein
MNRLQRPSLLRTARVPAAAGTAVLLAFFQSAPAQEPPPKAVPVEDKAAAPERPPTATTGGNEPAPGAAPEPRPAARPAQAPPKNTAPKSPEQDLFEFSELLFSKSNYPVAIQQYSAYLDIHPTGRYREDAIFKIAECYYLQDQFEPALEAFTRYLNTYAEGKHRAQVYYHMGESFYKLASRVGPERQAEYVRQAYEAYRSSVTLARSGPYACYAAFRLGSFSYNAARNDPERYKEAARWFTIAASQTPKGQPGVKVTSLFFLGRSQRYLGQKKEATATFNEVIKIKEDNRYYDKAWEELAQLDIDAGRSQEAMKKFERLARESVDAATRANSLVNTGMILADSEKAVEAVAKFEEVLQIQGEGARAARSRARFGLVWSSYKTKEYEKVIKAWRGLQPEDYTDLDEYSRARLWLIVGSSHAAQEMHAPAASTLHLLNGLVDSGSREVRDICLEGGYKRLVSLFKLNDPSTPDATDEYTRIWTEREPESAYIDKAWVVKGSFYFNRSTWDAAARAFKPVRTEKLEKDKAATLLYQRGCAEASCLDKDAITTLSTFIEQNPQDERAVMAQLQRAVVRMKSDDLGNALTDFEEVAKKAVGTESGETATFNAARVRGIRQEFPGMVAGFQSLLQNYPKTRAAAEANYWIGTGSYQLQKYKDCLEPLRAARQLDAKTYYIDATLMLIAALTALEEIDALLPEVDAFLKTNSEKKISSDILRWLGMKLFRERRDYAKCARYLGFVVTFTEPAKTAPDVWAAHGESLLEIKDYAGAIMALDNFLATTQPPAVRARTFLLRGRAQYGLAKYDDVEKSVEEGLDIDRETLVAAQLHLLAGDVAAAKNQLTEAVSSYGLVTNAWEDPVLTPTAMARLAGAKERRGEGQDKAEAEQLKKDLATRYPRFQLPK